MIVLNNSCVLLSPRRQHRGWRSSHELQLELNFFFTSSLSSLKDAVDEELHKWAAESETTQPQRHSVQGFDKEQRQQAASQWRQSVFKGVAYFLYSGSSRTRNQGLVSAAGSGAGPGPVVGEGWASVENQEDMADLALVRAPPTDWPVSRGAWQQETWHLKETAFTKLMEQEVM